VLNPLFFFSGLELVEVVNSGCGLSNKNNGQQHE